MLEKFGGISRVLDVTFPDLRRPIGLLGYFNIKTFSSFPPPPKTTQIPTLESANSQPQKKSGYWSDIEQRKNFLLAFAEKMGFDPKVQANWKGISTHIHANQVRASTMNSLNCIPNHINEGRSLVGAIQRIHQGHANGHLPGHVSRNG